MVIGLDFDNTIICYDHVFHRVAVEKGLIPAETPATKERVRDYLRSTGREETWIELQGYVYGERIREAEAFPGLFGFLAACRSRKVEVVIISHKTQFPFRGPNYDLHLAARGWLENLGFFGRAQIGLTREQVFFEPTKQRKLGRIAESGCQYFVDDLPEFLTEPAFPEKVRRILFDPAESHVGLDGIESARTWEEVQRIVLAEGVGSN